MFATLLFVPEIESSTISRSEMILAHKIMLQGDARV